MKFLRDFYSLLMKMKPEDILLFGDETGIELNHRLSKLWWIKGERPDICIESGRKRINVIGTIDVKNHTGFFAEIKKLDATQFLQFLSGLLNSFQIKGKIYLVVDNAPSHHAKKLEPFLKKNADRLKIVFLSPYSPDFNPIEILWRVIKKDVNTNEFFQTLDELREVLYNYLQQFKHPTKRIASLWDEKKWISKIEA